MVDRVAERFDLPPHPSAPPATPPTGRRRCWRGWSRTKALPAPCACVGQDATQRRNVVQQRVPVERDAHEYRCPQGHALRSEARAFKNPRMHVTKADMIIYRSSQADCATCPIKDRCCPNTPIRKIARSIHERPASWRGKSQPLSNIGAHAGERKKVEMSFAHLKRILKLDRLRLRGLSGATDEFTLAAAVQNLRRQAKLVAQGPPIPGIGALT